MLQRADLWSLEEYSEQRGEFRRRVLAHRENRRVMLGDHILLTFEDEMTIRYQIQEMLRVERIFEAAGIQDELDAYNPLIPDGDNLKCSLLIQFEDVEERKRRLTEMVGIEDKIWLRVGAQPRFFPIADEDMSRSNEEKTSAVHFLRYQLNTEQINAAKRSAPITAGVEHSGYHCQVVTLDEATRSSLAADLA